MIFILKKGGKMGKVMLLLLSLAAFSSSSEVSEMEKACKRKMPTACFELAILYEKGLRVDQNIVNAISYYEKACDYGYDKACQSLEREELKGLLEK